MGAARWAYLVAVLFVGIPIVIWVWRNPGNELYLLFVMPLVLGAGGIPPRAMIWLFLAFALFFFSMFFWAWGV